MSKPMSSSALGNILAKYPRWRLAHLPTPLEHLQNLSSRLGINLWMKRDDLTGLAFGGNKTRKLEYIIADAKQQRADTILSWAGVQSNWCRQLAAAANKAGMRAVLVLFRRAGLPKDLDGNLLLDFLCDAEIHALDLPAGTSMMTPEGALRSIIQSFIDQHERSGRCVYVAPMGASLLGGSMRKPLGAIAYVQCATELLEQCNQLGISPQSLVHATGSTSTQAGLLVGAKLLCPDLRVVGISVGADSATLSGHTKTVARQLFDEFGRDESVSEDDVVVFDEYFGQGYGLLDGTTAEAVRLVARHEGIMVDPVYNGKAMTGLFDLVRRGYIRQGQTVIFLNTGGAPAIFVYRTGLREFLRPNPSNVGVEA